MQWVYILKCSEGRFYVGQTRRLYRRFYEHENSCGGVNTTIYQLENIVAIYKAETICKFLDYNEYVVGCQDGHCRYKLSKLDNFNNAIEDFDELYAENSIAECLMVHNPDDWRKIRGGKYTRLDYDYTFPENTDARDLPLCHCNLPCDVRKSEDGYLYFRCAKKNMWAEFKDEFDIEDDPCKFYMKYTKDEQLVLKGRERRRKLKDLFKRSRWLENVEQSGSSNKCVGGCDKTRDSSKLSYNGLKRNLCFDCFIDKNEELKHKYNGKISLLSISESDVTGAF